MRRRGAQAAGGIIEVSQSYYERPERKENDFNFPQPLCREETNSMRNYKKTSNLHQMNHAPRWRDFFHCAPALRSQLITAAATRTLHRVDARRLTPEAAVDMARLRVTPEGRALRAAYERGTAELDGFFVEARGRRAA